MVKQISKPTKLKNVKPLKLKGNNLEQILTLKKKITNKELV